MTLAQTSCIRNHCLKPHPNSLFKAHAISDAGLGHILLIFLSFFVNLIINSDYTPDFVQSWAFWGFFIYGVFKPSLSEWTSN